MSKDKEKKDWFRGIDVNPFRFKRNSYLPFFDESADYNTNSKSYYDYLARINRILEVMKHFIIRLLDRDVKTKDTPTVSLKKEGDWIDNGEGNPPNNYDDDITLSANVKRSSGTSKVTFQDKSYTVGNALEEKTDGLYSPDFAEVLEDFEGGGADVVYSTDTETRNYPNISTSPFIIPNSSENKSLTDTENELWSPEYGNVLQAVDLRVGELDDLYRQIREDLDYTIENPPEPDFGFIHDTILPLTNIFYSYYNPQGELLGDREKPIFLFRGLNSGNIDLSPGNRDIVISFTPRLTNTDDFEITEVSFSLLDGASAQAVGSEVRNFRINNFKDTNIISSSEVISGRRQHLRLSTISDSDSYSIGGSYPYLLHANISNKHSGVTYKPWDLDGDKPLPLTADDMKEFGFRMEDVEIRVVNQ